MKRFLIGSATFIAGLVLVLLIMLAPLVRRIAEGKATGFGIVLSRENLISAVVFIVLLVAFSVWLSGKIIHMLNR
jgi:hypothetical protein